MGEKLNDIKPTEDSINTNIGSFKHTGISFNFIERCFYYGASILIGLCILLMFVYIVINMIPCISIKYDPNYIFSPINSIMSIIHQYWRASLVLLLLMFYRPIHRALMELENWWNPKESTKPMSKEEMKITKKPNAKMKGDM